MSDRNQLCPCGSGKKVKDCHPQGFGGAPQSLLWQNIIWGLTYGLAWAVFFILVAVVLMIVSRGAVETFGLAFSELVLVYLASGVAAGFVLGLMRPIVHRRAGAAATGIVVAFVVYGGFFSLFAGPPWHWPPLAWPLLAAISIVMGVPIGLQHWARNRRQGRAASA